MCYETVEEERPFVAYPEGIISRIRQDILESPLFFIKISGNSMLPTIKSGNMCICVSELDYNEGDIVSFYVPTQDNKVELIAHRIITENNNQFTTKGDLNSVQDPWIITENQIFCQIPQSSLFDKFKFAIESGGKFGIFDIVG